MKAVLVGLASLDPPYFYFCPLFDGAEECADGWQPHAGEQCRLGAHLVARGLFALFRGAVGLGLLLSRQRLRRLDGHGVCQRRELPALRPLTETLSPLRANFKSLVATLISASSSTSPVMVPWPVLTMNLPSLKRRDLAGPRSGVPGNFTASALRGAALLAVLSAAALGAGSRAKTEIVRRGGFRPGRPLGKQPRPAIPLNETMVNCVTASLTACFSSTWAVNSTGMPVLRKSRVALPVNCTFVPRAIWTTTQPAAVFIFRPPLPVISTLPLRFNQLALHARLQSASHAAAPTAPPTKPPAAPGGAVAGGAAAGSAVAA